MSHTTVHPGHVVLIDFIYHLILYIYIFHQMKVLVLYSVVNELEALLSAEGRDSFALDLLVLWEENPVR